MYAGWMLDAAKGVADWEIEWSRRDDGCNVMGPRRAGEEGCWGEGGGGRGRVTTPSRVSQRRPVATIQVHVDDAKGETEDEDEALTPLYIVSKLLPVHQRLARLYIKTSN
ncbi:hypothetical protein K438DRAFT_1774851 [Mycena galopus ATCC 62051]|nr:hypothetical protein K438DRAFT_1774851 [Mycena galopus ATCC 62051]